MKAVLLTVAVTILTFGGASVSHIQTPQAPAKPQSYTFTIPANKAAPVQDTSVTDTYQSTTDSLNLQGQ